MTIIDLSALAVNDALFMPTKNEQTNFERGEKGCISAEFYTLLLMCKGKKLRFNGYDYLILVVENGYTLILREKIN